MNLKKHSAIISLMVVIFLVTSAVLPTAFAAEDAEKQWFRLGTTNYQITIPSDFTEGELTENEIKEEAIVRMRNSDEILEFNVYQFSKEGYPEDLAAYAEAEAASYGATDIVTDGEINGIPVASYRSKFTVEGVEYDVLVYILDAGEDYAEVSFLLLTGGTSYRAALRTIETLERTEARAE